MLHLNKVCHDLCTLLGLLGIEYFLHRPEAGVIEALGKGHNIRRGHMLVLFGPGAAAQLVRLYERKDGKVEQRYLIRQHIGGHTQCTQDDRIQLLNRAMRWQTLRFVRWRCGCTASAKLNEPIYTYLFDLLDSLVYSRYAVVTTRRVRRRAEAGQAANRVLATCAFNIQRLADGLLRLFVLRLQFLLAFVLTQTGHGVCTAIGTALLRRPLCQLR